MSAPWEDVHLSPQERIDMLIRRNQLLEDWVGVLAQHNEIFLEFIGALFWRLRDREGSPQEFEVVLAGEGMVKGEGRGLAGATDSET